MPPVPLSGMQVLLKMYETGDAASLLPVLATILKLSPTEVR